MASLVPRQSVCQRCLRLARPPKSSQYRNYTSSGPREQTVEAQDEKKDVSQPSESPSEGHKSSSSSSSEPGAMTRRLQEATEDALLTGGRTSQKLVEDAGFSEELKEKLFNKVKEAQFRKKFSSAFAEAGISPSSSAVGEGTHHIATSAPWTGKETTHDAVLRMLDDSKKPLRPELRGKFQTPVPVDMRIKRDPAMSASQRVASARDKASAYAGAEAKASASSGKGLTPEEREDLRREFRERFQPGARAMPNSITGLAALANERIEDAIARGQFKDIPRGKGVERDARADNPFIDTTEYIMNKMIQRQDIVPPWIEKQQDLAKAAHTFRTRLRNDWKRHAARMIAAKGGSLLEQMQRAEDYAKAERRHNPRFRKLEETSISPGMTEDPAMVEVMKPPKSAAGSASDAAEPPSAGLENKKSRPLLPPFRDPDWEAAERAYMELSIDNLNSITRTYNLMAPDLAKKPYFSLQRELLGAFAEVAPQLANEIKERTTRVTSPGLGGGRHQTAAAGIFENFGGGSSPRIRLEAEEKAYGLKDWWRDVWKK
ncbi:unnamed protein product [Clonostachys rosea]|uniref:DnaJ homologue subfamily C member 28 conserved domain-containing protein n=1 Tax=Bionectria ochroleuca TaxID=29856 RepID=A0ABY6TRC4_BIOOC|nr:unnamed protein product [Clonostachys rosea]